MNFRLFSLFASALVLFAAGIAVGQPVAPELVSVDPVAADPGAPWLVALPALLVAISAFVSAVVPDDRLPGWLGAILNLLAQNWGAAKNDPRV